MKKHVPMNPAWFEPGADGKVPFIVACRQTPSGMPIWDSISAAFRALIAQDAAHHDEKRTGKADRREIGCDASYEARIAVGRDHTREYQTEDIYCGGTVNCARSNDRRRTAGTIADRATVEMADERKVEARRCNCDGVSGCYFSHGKCFFDANDKRQYNQRCKSGTIADRGKK